MIERSNVLAVGGTKITLSIISSHRVISACFLTTKSDKRMHLLTRLYGRLHKWDWKLLTWTIKRVRTLHVIVCILGLPRCYDSLSQKWPKMTTDNSDSETKSISSLKMAYSSEGVSTLNMDSEVKFLKPLRSTLQSYKIQEAKMANFFYLCHGLLTQWRQRIHQEVLISVYRYGDFAFATLLLL